MMIMIMSKTFIINRRNRLWIEMRNLIARAIFNRPRANPFTELSMPLCIERPFVLTAAADLLLLYINPIKLCVHCSLSLNCKSFDTVIKDFSLLVHNQFAPNGGLHIHNSLSLSMLQKQSCSSSAERRRRCLPSLIHRK